MNTKAYPSNLNIRANDKIWENIAAIQRMLLDTGFDASQASVVGIALNKYRKQLEREAAAVVAEGDGKNGS